jgi:hypothetical protein
VYLVLDKGHQNTRENEPATDPQNKHQGSLDQPGQRAGRPLTDLRHAHDIVISCAAKRGG